MGNKQATRVKYKDVKDKRYGGGEENKARKEKYCEYKARVIHKVAHYQGADQPLLPDF